MKLTLLLASTIAVILGSWQILRAQVPASAPDATVDLINQALTDARSKAGVDQWATLETAAQAVLQARPNNLLISKKLRTVLDQPETDRAKRAKALQTALSESVKILNFRMKKEADLPKGFPEPAPLGEVQLKHYPAYRLARAASTKDSAFFTLFKHIKSNKIEMTAPVEMRFDVAESRYQQVDMAFLYGEPDWGTLGDAGRGVTVQDIPAMTTVSIGLTGDFDPNSSTYIDALESWLTRNAPDYERDGQVRVMGYNSPFVWKSQRFFEIEIPVRKRTEAKEIANP